MPGFRFTANFCKSIANKTGLSGGIRGHLWINRYGSRCAAERSGSRSNLAPQAFAKAIWPYLFRDCAVTEIVDTAPEEIGIARDVLGHADLQTTKKQYIQAVGMVAHARVQQAIAALRRAAATAGTAGA